MRKTNFFLAGHMLKHFSSRYCVTIDIYIILPSLLSDIWIFLIYGCRKQTLPESAPMEKILPSKLSNGNPLMKKNAPRRNFSWVRNPLEKIAPLMKLSADGMQKNEEPLSSNTADIYLIKVNNRSTGTRCEIGIYLSQFY